MARHAPAPPPPPPPEKEDIPLPPSYNYPRFLEPEMEKSRKIIEAESSGWSRKTDEDLQKEKELSEHQKSLISAAEKAAKINKKLTGYEQKVDFHFRSLEIFYSTVANLRQIKRSRPRSVSSRPSFDQSRTHLHPDRARRNYWNHKRSLRRAKRAPLVQITHFKFEVRKVLLLLLKSSFEN